MKDNCTLQQSTCFSQPDNKLTRSGFKAFFLNKIFYSILILLSICGSSLKLQAQTTLAAGDLIFVGYNAELNVDPGNDQFAFILLKVSRCAREWNGKVSVCANRWKQTIFSMNKAAIFFIAYECWFYLNAFYWISRLNTQLFDVSGKWQA